jgi:predicted transcriptional regulator
MVSTKTTTLTVRLSNEVLAVIRRVSEETGQSQSQIVNAALAQWAKRVAKEERK